MATALNDDKKQRPAPMTTAKRVPMRRYMEDTRAELAKVTWPTRAHVLSSLGLILIVVTFYSLLVAASDGMIRSEEHTSELQSQR